MKRDWRGSLTALLVLVPGLLLWRWPSPEP